MSKEKLYKSNDEIKEKITKINDELYKLKIKINNNIKIDNIKIDNNKKDINNYNELLESNKQKDIMINNLYTRLLYSNNLVNYLNNNNNHNINKEINIERQDYKKIKKYIKEKTNISINGFIKKNKNGSLDYIKMNKLD